MTDTTRPPGGAIRGAMFGILISLPIWAVLIMAVWAGISALNSAAQLQAVKNDRNHLELRVSELQWALKQCVEGCKP